VEYVNGFMIDPYRREVIFIEKQRPSFQKGKWNGIGGKIEPNELAIHAMVREFHEEAGIETYPEAWQHVLDIAGPDFTVHFYRMFVDGIPPATQKTDERLGVWRLRDIYPGSEPGLPTLDNMKWILPLMFTASPNMILPVQVLYR
jgi:8-oxo-dGTP diphosphatase